MNKKDILKAHLTDIEKGTWNAIQKEGEFIQNLLISIQRILSPKIRDHLYNQIKPEIDRLKSEKNRLEITAQIRYEESLKRGYDDGSPFKPRKSM